MISHGDKFVTSRQVPVEADVSCNVLSAVNSEISPALAVDSGLKWMIRENHIHLVQSKLGLKNAIFLTFTFMYHVLVLVSFQPRHRQGRDDTPFDIQNCC